MQVLACFFRTPASLSKGKWTAVVAAQLLSHVRLCNPMDSQFSTISQSLLKLISIELVMLSNHLILCHPLLLLPSVFPSIRVFSNEPVLRIRWPKYWSFSFSISPSNEYSGLISFRIDWFDLLAGQGTLKSLFQHHGSKASILQHSALSDFGAQENKVCHCLNCFPICLPWRDRTGCHDLSFLNVEF